MICETIPFKVEHLDSIEEQDAEMMFGKSIPRDSAVLLEDMLSRTITIDGKPVLCGGVIEYWPGRGEIWALIDKNTKKDFVAIHRATMAFLDECPHNRLEAVVVADFDAGKRWIGMLGFRLETPEPMKAYCPNGADAYLYARFK